MNEVFPNSRNFPKINDSEIYIGDAQGKPISNPISGDGTIDNTGKLTIPNGNFGKVVKSADETIVNDDVLHDDLELKVTLQANKSYGFMMMVLYTSIDPMDIRFQIPTDSDGEVVRTNQNTDIPTTPVANFFPSRNNSANPSMYSLFGVINTSTTAGDFIIRWSQSNPNANPTTVQKGSYFLVWES